MSKIELTNEQKRFIINYLMCYSKGIVEDDEFWGEITQEEIDTNFDSYADAIDEFIASAKEALIHEVVI